MNKQVFKDVVAFLYELQQKQPLEEIIFYPYVDTNIDVYDLYECMMKIKKDLSLIKNIETPEIFVYPFDPENPYPDLGQDIHNLWQVELSPAFPDWAENVLSFEEEQAELPAMEIRLLPDRTILLNNTFVLSKPNFNSPNEVVFDFLYKNPNKRWSKKEIEQQLNIKITKDLDKIVENLGFKNDLRKIFWQVSKADIQFNNPVSPDAIKELGITTIRI